MFERKRMYELKPLYKKSHCVAESAQIFWAVLCSYILLVRFRIREIVFLST